MPRFTREQSEAMTKRRREADVYGGLTKDEAIKQMIKDSDEHRASLKKETKSEPKKRGRPKNIMKGRADLDGNKVSTELKIKKGLEPKVKRALKKSVIAELDNKMKGGRIRSISLSDSDDDKNGKGFFDSDKSDSDSDDERMELKKVLKHLLRHIANPKEKKDKMDLQQAKEILMILCK